MVKPFWKTVWQCLRKHMLTTQASTPIPRYIYPRELKTCLHRKLFVLYLSMVVVTLLSMCDKTHETVHLQLENFIVYKLYLSKTD